MGGAFFFPNGLVRCIGTTFPTWQSARLFSQGCERWSFRGRGDDGLLPADTSAGAPPPPPVILARRRQIPPFLFSSGAAPHRCGRDLSAPPHIGCRWARPHRHRSQRMEQSSAWRRGRVGVWRSTAAPRPPPPAGHWLRGPLRPHHRQRRAGVSLRVPLAERFVVRRQRWVGTRRRRGACRVGVVWRRHFLSPRPPRVLLVAAASRCEPLLSPPRLRATRGWPIPGLATWGQRTSPAHSGRRSPHLILPLHPPTCTDNGRACLHPSHRSVVGRRRHRCRHCHPLSPPSRTIVVLLPLCRGHCGGKLSGGHAETQGNCSKFTF